MNLVNIRPTFLQKILGKNYKWWYIIWYSLISETGGKIGFIAGYFASILRIVTTNFIWFLAGADQSTFTYLLIGKIYQQITDNIYYYRLSESVYSGSITNNLMYPLSFSRYNISNQSELGLPKTLLDWVVY